MVAVCRFKFIMESHACKRLKKSLKQASHIRLFLHILFQAES